MKTEFILISDPIRSGKTSRLIHWLKGQPNTFAILMPDLALKRKLYFHTLNLILPLEVYEHDFTNTSLVQIGRFTFLKENFELAQNLLLNAIETTANHLVLDEIGKLEFKNQAGFEPALSKGLQLLKHEIIGRTCYLVIRDYLLLEAKLHYNLQDSLQMSSEQLQGEKTELKLRFVALLLCGGASRRMKQPKALLHYHEVPQYLWLNHLVQPLVDSTFIACKKEQANWFDPTLTQLHDKPSDEEAGPLAGLIALLETNIHSAALLVGCDYPLLPREYLQQLTEACQLFEVSVALSKGINEAFEPMLCCLHPKDFEAIKKLNKEENQNSLSKILSSIKALKIVVEKPNALKSFDTPEDFASFNQHH